MITVAVGLGGNLGEPAALEARLRGAARLIGAGRIDFRLSPFYWTEPWGPVAEQPRFLNAACAFAVPASTRPLDLLVELWRIERGLGRRRCAEVRYGPRPIDLDILVWGSRQVSLPVLAIPHPRLAEREFALRPLADVVAPELLRALALRDRKDGADSRGGER